MSATKTTGRFEDVRVGDSMWIGKYHFPRRLIVPVVRVTPTLVIAVRNGKEESYYRANGYRKGLRYADTLSAKATREEIAVYELECEAKKKDADERRKNQEAIEAKAREISGVCDNDRFIIRGGQNGVWEIEIQLLTETQARQIALAVKQIIVRNNA